MNGGSAARLQRPTTQTLDTQTYNSFGTDFIGLGSESGNEVVIYALAYARNSSDTANAQHTVTVTASAESDDDENGDESDGENGGDSSANAPAAQSYPLLEVHAGCGKSEWWDAPRDLVPDLPLLLEPLELGVKNNLSSLSFGRMLIGGGTHLMHLKVTPSSVGDAMSYSGGEIWKGVAEMEIDKHRPGGNVHSYWEGIEPGPGICSLESYTEFSDPNDPLTHPLDKGEGVEVVVKVVQKDGWQLTIPIPLGRDREPVTINIGFTPGAHDVEFWHGPPVSIETTPLEGKGTTRGSGVAHTEDCPAPLPATTSGEASARWNTAPPEAKVEPPAWARHVSPDGNGGSNEDCNQGVGVIGAAQAADGAMERQ